MQDKKRSMEHESILGWIYDMYQESHPAEHEVIKRDFEELYNTMNGMQLAEMDKIIYPVCTLCRDYERIGFCEGVRLGVQLARDLGL